MNVLYILNSTSVTGGATKSFLTLIRGFIPKGVTPYVVVPDRGELYDLLIGEGIHTLVLAYFPSVYPPVESFRDKVLFVPRILRNYLCEKKVIKVLEYLCREKSIDIIHTNVSVETVGIKTAKVLGIPHVMHFREYADIDFRLHYFPTKRMFYSLLNDCNSYSICITRGIQNHHNQHGDHTRLIYNGIEVEGIGCSHERLCASPYFLYAGRIESAKGVMQVLEAYYVFIQSNSNITCNLMIAGAVNDEDYYKMMLRFVSDKQIEDKVRFLGPRNDVRDLMQDAMATIVSSDFEAFGRCLPEAMLCGCLTIGKNTAGTKEQYDNGLKLIGKEIGFRYETTEELARIMCCVYDAEPSFYDEMKANAKRTVTELYSKDKYVNDVYDYYREILSK